MDHRWRDRHPDGRHRRYVRRITREVHNVTIINNITYINRTVFRRRGWHHHRGIHYYHHPYHHRLIAIHYGDIWFWMYYHNDRWWWYHSGYSRWVSWDGHNWWYWHPTYGWMVWYHPYDRFYRVYPDRIVREVPTTPPPTSPPADEEEEEEEVVYSEDGTLIVYILGEKRMAHLYTYPELEHLAYLGEDVKSVRFTKDQYNNDELIVFVEFKNGSIGLFDRYGSYYGLPPAADEEAEEEDSSVSRVEGALDDLPGGISAPAELPDAPPIPEGVVIQ